MHDNTNTHSSFMVRTGGLLVHCGLTMMGPSLGLNGLPFLCGDSIVCVEAPESNHFSSVVAEISILRHNNFTISTKIV